MARGRRWRVVVGALVVATLCAAASPSVALADPTPPSVPPAGGQPPLPRPAPGAPGPIPVLPLPGQPVPPDRDPFYAAPSGTAAARPGDVLRSRAITALAPTQLTGTRTVQLLYRSTGASGEPIATVATLLLPNVPAPGPRRLVSYHPAEDSLTTRCAPSYTLRTSSGSTQPAESGAIAALLARGWDVVVPDYEGPRSEFAVGRLEGQAALDGVRAAERFAASGLDGTRTRVGMMGYSGGSIPTGWANALAREYAPELDLVGIAAGGVAARLRDAVGFNDGRVTAGAILAASVGLDRAYPDFDLPSLLTARGRALADRDGRDADGCSGGLANAPGARIADLTPYPTAEALLAVPRVARTVARTDLVAAPVFRAPAYVFHEIHDEILPIGPVDDLVAATCRRGVAVDYHRGPVGEHIVGAGEYLGPGMQYLADRFAGVPAPACATGS